MTQACGQHTAVRSEKQHDDASSAFATASAEKIIWANTPPGRVADRRMAKARAAEDSLIAMRSDSRAALLMKLALLLDWIEPDCKVERALSLRLRRHLCRRADALICQRCLTYQSATGFGQPLLRRGLADFRRQTACSRMGWLVARVAVYRGVRRVIGRVRVPMQVRH
jgi:hypothetical protein